MSSTSTEKCTVHSFPLQEKHRVGIVVHRPRRRCASTIGVDKSFAVSKRNTSGCDHVTTSGNATNNGHTLRIYSSAQRGTSRSFEIVKKGEEAPTRMFGNEKSNP
ncbi:unnamed protein product, partial [Ectocarpus sp. 12 AP-2014]